MIGFFYLSNFRKSKIVSSYPSVAWNRCVQGVSLEIILCFSYNFGDICKPLAV